MYCCRVVLVSSKSVTCYLQRCSAPLHLTSCTCMQRISLVLRLQQLCSCITGCCLGALVWCCLQAPDSCLLQDQTTVGVQLVARLTEAVHLHPGRCPVQTRQIMLWQRTFFCSTSQKRWQHYGLDAFVRQTSGVFLQQAQLRLAAATASVKHSLSGRHVDWLLQ